MFSKKREVSPRTEVRCVGCGKSEERGFAPGDVLFAESECPCGGAARIERIFDGA